jgi:hypothetical protein
MNVVFRRLSFLKKYEITESQNPCVCQPLWIKYVLTRPSFIKFGTNDLFTESYSIFIIHCTHNFQLLILYKTKFTLNNI